jgi:hypothetical protein
VSSADVSSADVSSAESARLSDLVDLILVVQPVTKIEPMRSISRSQFRFIGGTTFWVGAKPIASCSLSETVTATMVCVEN